MNKPKNKANAKKESVKVVTPKESVIDVNALLSSSKHDNIVKHQAINDAKSVEIVIKKLTINYKKLGEKYGVRMNAVTDKGDAVTITMLHAQDKCDWYNAPKGKYQPTNAYWGMVLCSHRIPQLVKLGATEDLKPNTNEKVEYRFKNESDYKKWLSSVGVNTDSITIKGDKVK